MQKTVLITNQDLELLISHAIKKPRSFVIAHPEYIFSKTEIKKLINYITRYSKYEPIAYILGYKEFFELKFKVTKDTLIPRSETETLVDLSIQEIKELIEYHIFNPFQKYSKQPSKPQQVTRKTQQKTCICINILEIGTGTGCIPISILHELNKSNLNYIIKILAIDISDKALQVAKDNWRTYHTHNNCHKLLFKKIDILDSKQVHTLLKDKKFDLIISNPPYIPSEEFTKLEKSVSVFEPRIALDGGKDGLIYYKAIFSSLKAHNQQSTVILEIHENKAKEVKNIMKKYLNNYQENVIKDIFGKDRFIKIKSKNFMRNSKDDRLVV